MDNVTHTLTAFALSHAGLNRKTRFATLAVVIGANLPDVDAVTWLDSTATYLKYHRGITHSLVGVTVLALLLAAALYLLGKRAAPKKSGPPLAAGWLVLAAWVGTSSHLLLDFTNAYGVRLFLPFTDRWYAWDIMFISDVPLLIFMLAAFGVAGVLRLTSEEVGARKPDFRRAAIVVLVALPLLWLVRDVAHRRAVTWLDSHLYAQESPRRVGAFPGPFNPFQWVGVAETATAFHTLEVSAGAFWGEPSAREVRVFYKSETSPALDAALSTRTAEIFLAFARFPWARAEETRDGYVVEMRDLRFFLPQLERRRFVAEIELDRELRPRSEWFRFAASSRRGRE
jgi:inner membrane protein